MFQHELKNAYIGEYHEPRILEDNFSGTTLNATNWNSKIYTSGTITVNNSLTLSGGGSGTQGPEVYTKKTFSGDEKKITVECSISSEGGTYLEAKRGILPDITYTYPIYIIAQAVSGYNNTSRALYQTSATAENELYSQPIVARPYTTKIILNCTAGTWEVYMNNTLYYSGSVGYALSNCIGRPIFGAGALSRTSVSCTLSSVKITVEY